jgi:hypothetical protein
VRAGQECAGAFGRYKLVKDLGRQDGFKAGTVDAARLSSLSHPWRWCVLHKV